MRCSSEEWLSRAGDELLNRIVCERPQFLIEINVARSDIEAMFLHLGRMHREDFAKLPIRACLAVAAIHAAAWSERDENRFIESFYDKLQKQYDPLRWNESYGPAIERFLRQFFPDADNRRGPFRYVGPIYQNAGVTARAMPAFAKLCRALSKQGIDFTRPQYERAVHVLLSNLALPYLKSLLGYEFTRKTVQLLSRVEQDSLPAEQLKSLPGYRANFWPELVTEIRKSGPVIPAQGYPPPLMALDLESWKLVLRFDKRGIKQGVYRFAGRTVLYEEEEFLELKKPEGEIVSQAGCTSWYVEHCWWPGKTCAALFRASDGAFVADRGTVRAGAYYLVANSAIDIPDEIVPVEEGYSLEFSAECLPICKVNLPPGRNYSELGFETSEANSPPGLEFEMAPRHSLGRDVFEQHLPRITVYNWTPENALRHGVWLDVGNGPRPLSIEAGSEYIEIDAPCPCRGDLWIELNGYSRHERELPHLRFAVVPHGIQVHFPELTCISNASLLKMQLTDTWVADFPDCIRNGNEWRIAPGVRIVEGSIEGGGIAVPVSLRVPRVTFEFGDSRVCWQEELSRDTKFRFEVPEHRSGTLMLADGAYATEIYPFHSHQGLKPNLDYLSFRDALSSFEHCAGEFVFHLDQGDRIPTGCFYVSGAANVESKLSMEPLNSTLFQLPQLGECLLGVRRLFESTQANLAVARSLDSPLRDYLCALVYGAAMLEHTKVDVRAAELELHVSPDVRELVNWMGRAREHTNDFQQTQELLDGFPGHIDDLPILRWRDQIGAIKRELESHDDLFDLILEWKEKIRSFGQSRLSARSGGEILTEGVLRYQNAALNMSDQRRRKNLIGAIDSFRSVLNLPGCDPLVRVLAAAFFQLSLYRSDHPREASLAEIPAMPPALCRLEQTMKALAAFCKGSVIESQDGAGIGFSEISPFAGDAELEHALGQSAVKGMA